MPKSKKAFTLIELLVVIAVIGVLATISVIALSNARSKSRDAKRVGNMKQVQTALELFFNDNGRYPTVEEWDLGTIYSTTSDATTTYMQVIPTAPVPADGDCSESENTLVYTQVENGASYSIAFCLGNTTGAITPGNKTLIPAGIIAVVGGGGGTPAWTCGTDTVTDVDGNIYNTTLIGSQCWTTSNLKTTKYNDGSDIEYLADNTAWSNNVSGAYCWAANNIANKDIYGALYNWYAVDTGKLCPSGFRVASYDDFLQLLATAANDGFSGQEGEALKSTSGWYAWDGNENGVDYYGFSFLPGGYRTNLGVFQTTATWGFILSSTEWVENPNAVHNLNAGSFNDSALIGNGYSKPFGLSVRCIKN